MEDNKYYCPFCDWYWKPSEVDDKDDGITDVLCPDCDNPLHTDPQH